MEWCRAQQQSSSVLRWVKTGNDRRRWLRPACPPEADIASTKMQVIFGPKPVLPNFSGPLILRAQTAASSSECHERVLSGIVVDERPLRPNRTEVKRRRRTDIGIYRPARVAAGEGVRHTIAA